MKIFNVYGDSHSYFGWKDIQIEGVKIVIYHIGPILMHSVGNRSDLIESFSNGLPKIGLKSEDHICFTFGEIDCRNHIYKHSDEKGINHESVINEVVDKYFSTINLCKSKHPEVNFYVYNVVPTPKQSDILETGHQFPHLGTDEQRKNYVSYMNKKLREYCLLNHYTFINIWEFYALDDGFMNPKYFDGQAHINDKCFLEGFLKLILV